MSAARAPGTPRCAPTMAPTCLATTMLTTPRPSLTGRATPARCVWGCGCGRGERGSRGALRSRHAPPALTAPPPLPCLPPVTRLTTTHPRAACRPAPSAPRAPTRPARARSTAPAAAREPTPPLRWTAASQRPQATLSTPLAPPPTRPAHWEAMRPTWATTRAGAGCSREARAVGLRGRAATDPTPPCRRSPCSAGSYANQIASKICKVRPMVSRLCLRGPLRACTAASPPPTPTHTHRPAQPAPTPPRGPLPASPRPRAPTPPLAPLPRSLVQRAPTATRRGSPPAKPAPPATFAR